ncbi:F-box only protein 2 isoform 2-T3 [Discoglossus pictus]
MESFPEVVLARILAEIPAEDLILVCRLVCNHWKVIVDGADVWKIKCQHEGFIDEERETDPDNWKNFYFLIKRRKNLIKNHSGEVDLEFWQDLQCGGDGWKVEDLPGDNGRDFPIEGVRKYFSTSFEWCSKAQLIDLLKEGYWEELMDTDQPNIIVGDWYAARSDAGCLYELCVQLLSDNHDVITEYKSDIITIPQFSDANWNSLQGWKSKSKFSRCSTD